MIHPNLASHLYRPMKNITLEIPRNGASVQFLLRAGESSGQVVIIASDNVEIRFAEPAPPPAALPKPASIVSNGKAAAAKVPTHDLDSIFKRLLKLKPTKRATAVNAIKTMFQFDAPINDQEAGKILEDLRKRGNLTIDAKDKLQLRNS